MRYIKKILDIIKQKNYTKEVNKKQIRKEDNMILEFKTARNKTNGSRKWLHIDTDKKKYTTQCPRMIPDGIEIKAKDYRSIIEMLHEEGYKSYFEF